MCIVSLWENCLWALFWYSEKGLSYHTNSMLVFSMINNQTYVEFMCFMPQDDSPLYHFLCLENRENVWGLNGSVIPLINLQHRDVCITGIFESL